MGSKQALSNGKEPEEATDMIAAFQLQNSCNIIITASVELHNGYLDWKWEAMAVSREKLFQGALPLVLANVSVWAGDYKTLMAVLTRLLYALDFQLALEEFDKVPTK